MGMVVTLRRHAGAQRVEDARERAGVAGIHVLNSRPRQAVDGRDKPGHDAGHVVR